MDDDLGHRWRMPWERWLRALATDLWRGPGGPDGLPANREVPRAGDPTSRLPPSSGGREGPPPTEPADARELAERLDRALADLDEASRAVLRMRATEGRGYEEIGRLLGIGAAAARRRYGQALIRLQQMLSDHGLLE